jgi:hypothetical protein
MTQNHLLDKISDGCLIAGYIIVALNLIYIAVVAWANCYHRLRSQWKKWKDGLG